MMSNNKGCLLILAAGILATSSAFEVNFWLGPECTSDNVGNGQGNDPGNSPCSSIPVNAESATVEMQQVDSSNDNVEFYSSSNCDSSTYVASTNGGCIDFTGAGGNAIAWQVQDSLSDPGRKKLRIKGREVSSTSSIAKQQAPWWFAEQEKVRSDLNLSTEAATGSLSPIWDPLAHVQAGFGHGNVTERWGRTWKWQQVALGMSIGIPLEDWDDAVHVSSNQFIPFGDVDYEAQLLHKRAGSSGYYEGSLEKRWDYGNCRSLLDCGRQFTTAATANIGNGWTQAVMAAYKLKYYGSTFYDFAHAHPFSVGITTAGATAVAGYGLGYTHGGATAQDNDQLGNCSGDSTQVNSFIQALIDAAGAGGDSAAETNITLPNGHILTISAEIYPKGSPPETTQCDADGSS